MNNIRVLSLGAGVQSSALFLFLHKFSPEKLKASGRKYSILEEDDLKAPDISIFADTGAEPKAVYDWIKFLKDFSKKDIVKTQYDNLFEEPEKRNFSTVPLFYEKNGKKSLGRRFCTSMYKINPIDKRIKKFLGVKKWGRVKDKVKVITGISADEVSRVKKSMNYKWKEYSYPLVQLGVTRRDCLSYVKEITGRTPPRSACVFCPYKSTSEWIETKKNPDDWKIALKFDAKIRNLRMGKEQYVHRSLKPLNEIEFKESKSKQYSFEDECDGFCGV